MKTAIFIFRRDLRLYNNTTLEYVSKEYQKIIPVFFLTEEQVGENNEYKSERCIEFMMKVLDQFKVPILKIKSYKEIPLILEKTYGEFHGIFFNKDYTPYAIERDDYIKSYCKRTKIECRDFHDQLLLHKTSCVKPRKPYSKFTPYYNNVMPYIKRISEEKEYIKEIREKEYIKDINKKMTVKLKWNYKIRDEAFKILDNEKLIKNYSKNRNIMIEETTGLSVYFKFGVISPREALPYFKKSEELLKQLLWRDFYYTYYWFNKDYSGSNLMIKWKKSEKNLNLWKNGMTGFPIVDACMRELKERGTIPNRGRMIVASLLSKNLLIDWREGEKHFSQNLIDIDRIQNTAGWHSVAGVEKHSLPYFRIFNPFLQSEKYDKKCEYIKKWIPELKDVLAKDIHKWNEKHSVYKTEYPKPIVDYKESKEEFLKAIIKK